MKRERERERGLDHHGKEEKKSGDGREKCIIFFVQVAALTPAYFQRRTINILVQKCKILTAVHSFFEYQSRQSTSVSSFLHCIFYHVPRSYYPQNVDQANWENNQVACETLFHWVFSFLFHIFLESTDNYPIINPPPSPCSSQFMGSRILASSDQF